MKINSICKKAASAAVALLFAFTFAAGCGGNKNKTVEAQIWTMPSTVKVLRDGDYSENYTETPKLVFETAKNEYESAQLFITPKNDVKRYSVSVSDFTDGKGNVISKDNVNVYHEKYVEIVSPSSTTSGQPLGYYPDALVPIEAAAEAGETSVKAGQNQGVWFTLFTPKDAKAGTYTASVTLTADGKSFAVPVTLTVWDFEVPDKSNLRNTYYIFPEYLMGGELNNTPEMYKNYVDYMLGYRISTTSIVCPVNVTETEWVALMKEYAANERCTSYKLGTEYPFNEERQVKLLVENSEKGLNLLEKAIFYPYDEPFGVNQAPATAKSKELVDMLIKIADEYEEDYLAERGLTRDDILKIPVLITTVKNYPIDGLRTYCPLIDEFDTPAGRAKYEEYKNNVYTGADNELAGTDYGSTWWYTCGVNPRYPWTTFVIDEDLVGSRVLSWMQHDYGIDGFLYWGVGSYFKTDGMNDNINGWKPADIWNVGNDVIGTANGDGYIVYPGAKYGLDEPIPTLRLMSIRDGYEDYEYLYKMQSLLDEYGDKYRTDALENALDVLYSSLYSGTIAKSDYDLVLQARRTLASMLELAESDAHAFVLVNETDGEKSKTTVEVYAASGSSLTVGGSAVTGVTSGDGVKFVYDMPLTNDRNVFEAELSVGGETYDISVFVSNKVGCVSDFEDADEIAAWSVSKRESGEEHIFVSLNTDTSFIKFGSGSMKIEAIGKEWTPEERKSYTARVTIGGDRFAPSGSIENIDCFELFIFNPQSKAVTVGVALVAQDGTRERTREIASFTLEPGMNRLRVTDVYKTVWKRADKDLTKSITGVALCLPLIEEDIVLYADGFSYVCR